MKRLNITLPDPVYKNLLSFIGRGNISSFLAELAEKEMKDRKAYLAQCYKGAAENQEIQKELEDWNVTETEDWP